MVKWRRASGPEGSSATGDPVLERSRRRARRAATGAVAGLVLVSGYAGALGASALLGDRAWQAGRHADAERWFRVADAIDVVERWKAPYDVGVAVFSQDRWAEAADLFARAREVVPAHSLCRVALNEALALEVLGDELDDAGDEAAARSRWMQAQEVLAAAEGCSAGEGDAGDEGEQESEDESSSKSGADGSTDDAAEGDDAAEEEEGQDGSDSDSESESESDGESDSGADGGGESDGDGQDGEGTPSEADQLQQATDRLQEKVTGSPVRPGEGQSEEPTEEEKAAELQERASGAARRRATAQDSSAPTSGGTPGQPTW